MRDLSWWLNRTLCDVLEDMRRCNKTRNYASLDALIEEAQAMGNRMESAIGDKNDVKKMNDEWHRLNKEIKRLRRKKAKHEGTNKGRARKSV